MTFCYTGTTVTLTAATDADVISVDLSSADPVDGALRFTTPNSGPYYISFSGSASPSDMQLNAGNLGVREIFKIPAGCTSMSVYIALATEKLTIDIGRV